MGEPAALGEAAPTVRTRIWGSAVTTWDIDATTALGILNRAGTSVGEYKTTLDALDRALDCVADRLGNSALVRTGVGLLGSRVVTPTGTAIRGASGSAVAGTRNAVGHYQGGQYDMAALAQRRAAGLTTPAELPGRRTGGALRRPGREVVER
ncbi:DUF6507 family protein [Luteipulveratus flavus]|uniref:DUF6507 family protein n=2 Tax=Luteipulveratus flavus TaxID=3031728 RepID=A0ABT6C8H6_9MICO|nr:DUF6507 family protein [Luteipulveratus sp. YIM 133296]MDF8265190.1 DUF6507 family protein [Luteipulveratus sp. YIM 133296]